MLSVGSRLGPYAIIAPLGAGGMGEVYRARDPRLGRDVAIKVLLERLAADPQALARFEREARAVAALSHPNILAIHDFGNADGIIYAVAELLEGETLRQRLSHGHLPLRKAVEIGTAVSEGLSAAHSKGFIHRDLKPENIFLTSDGRVKILDFGLARAKPVRPTAAMSAAPTETEPGTIMGTASYMSPEQVRGEVADAPSDIFSLGCVLYETIAGHNPFTRDTAVQTMTAILEHDPPRLGCGSDLERVVTRCLEKNPAQRFQSANDLAFALTNVSVQSPKTQRRNVWIGGAIVALMVIAPASLWLGRNIAGQPRVSSIQSLAVLPLQNLSRDVDQEFFADGTTEALISTLAQIRALRVISRTSVMRYKGSNKSLPEIARDLHVDAVVVGSVQRDQSRVRIRAQLIHAATDTHLWAKEYERDLTDMLRLQSDVADAIAQEIRIQVTPDERSRLARSRSVKPQAHEAYLLGRYHMRKHNESDLAKAIGHFERAVQLDPAYAPAHAALSSTWRFRGIWGAKSLQAVESQARASARMAVELDDNLAEAHHAVAVVKEMYDWDWAGAEAEFRRAIELDPNNPDARFDFAFLLQTMDRLPEAVAQIQRAQELDPVSSTIESSYGRTLYRARKYDEAIVHFQRAMELDPQDFSVYGRLADVYEQLGRFQEAIDVEEKAAKLSGRRVYRLRLAHIYAVMGRRNQALRLIEETKAEGRITTAEPIALIYAALGDKDQSFEWLEKAFANREVGLTWIKTEPKYDPLRSDPRYIHLLRRMQLLP